MNDAELGAGLSCFIIGPIGDRLEPAGSKGKLRHENATQMWEHVFEPACAVFGLTPIRADKISETGEIPEQIFQYLRDADVVIADVTGGNANVMYELGLRHTRSGITIQIGEHERLPFDVNTIRTVKFKRTEAGLIDARDNLVEALRSSLQGNGLPVTATRVWQGVGELSTEAVKTASALSFVEDDPADALADDPPGNLELLAEGEAAIEVLSEILGQLTNYMTEMTAIAEEATPLLVGAESFAAKLTAVRQFAERLRPTATGLEASSQEYLMRVEQVDAMIGVIADQLGDPDSEDDLEELEEFVSSLEVLAESAGEGSVAFTGTLKVVRDMRKWSNVLKPVSKSLEHSLNTILRGNEIVMSWGARLRAAPPRSDEDGVDA